jgi:hypothetical protein
MSTSVARAEAEPQEQSSSRVVPVHGAQRQAVLANLQEQIRRVQAAPRRYLVTLATGVAELDALGAFRLGTGVELSGEEASGRASLALSLVAAAGREHRLSAWVDGPRELYPPAAVPLGVDLKRLLIVRPGAPAQLVWSAVQLLRSGAFTCVVLDVTHTGVRLTQTDTRKLLDAARAGGALLVVLTTAAAQAPGLARLLLSNPAVAQEPVSRLRLATTPPSGPQEPEPVLEQGLATTPHGRELRWARGGLLTTPVPRARRGQVLPGLALPGLMQERSFARPRAHLQRDGAGFFGDRPGRDRPLVLPPPPKGPARREPFQTRSFR